MSKKPVIVFEGIEGSGKTFYINLILNYLKKKELVILNFVSQVEVKILKKSGILY